METLTWDPFKTSQRMGGVFSKSTEVNSNTDNLNDSGTDMSSDEKRLQ